MVLASKIGKKKKKSVGIERKKKLFALDVTVYVENLKQSGVKPLDQINSFISYVKLNYIHINRNY